MPYYSDPNLLDEEEQQAQGAKISGASPTTEAQGTGGGGGTPSNKPGQLNTGSGYNNLEKYLAANKGQNFGGQILGKVQGEIQGARDSQNRVAGQVGANINSANALPTDEQVKQAIADPTKGDAKQFQNWEHQTYAGPNGIYANPGTSNQFWDGTNKAGTDARLLGTESGRYTLLDSYFGKNRPNYTTGEKDLDNLLIEQSGLGRQNKRAREDAAHLQDEGDKLATGLGNQALARGAAVDESSKGVRKAVGIDEKGNIVTGADAGALGKYEQAIRDRTAANNTTRQKAIEKAKADLAAGNITAQEAQLLGLGNQDLYGVDPTKYFTGAKDYTDNQTLTPDERAYIRALDSLSGATDTFAKGDAEAASPDYTFDKARFDADVGSQKAGYDRELGDWLKTASGDWQNGPTDPAELYRIDKEFADTPGINDQLFQGRQAKARANAQAYEALFAKYNPRKTLKVAP